MVLSELASLELVLAAFAGGAFGAAIGALPSFVLCGLFVALGEVNAILHRSLGSGPPAVDLTGAIAFGPVLGPHVAFGGGAAAVAYLAKRDDLDVDFPYHDAKCVTRGLGTRPDVLAVGGAFGVLGAWIATAAGSLDAPTDPVALGVVGSALVHRAGLGYPLVGASPGRLLDMSPYRRGERRDSPAESGSAVADGGEPVAASERFAVEPWLPYQYRWSHVAAIGVVSGILGAYVAYRTGSAFLAFGISVVALAFVVAGVDDIPITHHMTLPASTVVLAYAGVDAGGVAPATLAAGIPVGEALLLGAAAGLIGALLGEFAQRVFYAHTDTHLDPPAASIVVTTLGIGLLAWLGVLPAAAWIPGV